MKRRTYARAEHYKKKYPSPLHGHLLFSKSIHCFAKKILRVTMGSYCMINSCCIYIADLNSVLTCCTAQEQNAHLAPKMKLADVSLMKCLYAVSTNTNNTANGALATSVN